jgi:hypothetical protein
MKNVFLLLIIFLNINILSSQCKPLKKEIDEFNGKIILSYGDKGFFGNSLKANNKKDNSFGKVMFTKIDTVYYLDFDLSCSFVWGVTNNSIVEIKLKGQETLNLKVVNNTISNYSSGGAGSFYNNNGRISTIINKEILQKLSTSQMERIRIAINEDSIMSTASGSDKIMNYAKCLLNDKNS